MLFAKKKKTTKKTPKHINDKTTCIVIFFHFVSKCTHHAGLFSQKQQLFGDELFEYRDLMLSTLPAVTVSYQTWLHMQVRIISLSRV